MTDKKIYRKEYSSFTGIDTSAPPSMIESFRLADAENMYIDYSAGQGKTLETVPGFRKIFNFGDKIYGIFCHRFSGDEGGKGQLIIHAGDKLYRLPIDERDQAEASEPIMTGLAERHSVSFAAGDALFILDTVGFYRVNANGVCQRLTADDAYIPTTMYRGEVCEDKNILTDKFRNLFTLADTYELVGDEDILTYRILDEELATCTVTGMKNIQTGCIVIPSYTYINGKQYTVSQIGFGAFAESNISFVTIPHTVKSIEGRAFFRCKSLSVVIIPRSVTEIGESAFNGSSSISEVHLGSGVERIHAGAFSGLAKNCVMYFEGNESEFSIIEIENSEYFKFTPVYMSDQPSYRAFYHRVSDGCNRIVSVFADEDEAACNDVRADISYFAQKTEMEGIDGVYIYLKNGVSTQSRKISVIAEFSPSVNAITDSESFFSAHSEFANNAFNAIAKCSVAKVHADSVFITGNNQLPNTVFRSCKDFTGCMNPLYFGIHSFMEDGIGNTPNVAMISSDETLIVIKSEANQGSSVYYHTLDGDGDCSGMHGTAALGRVLAVDNFLDDPVILSDSGMFGIDTDNVNLEKSINRRSSNIDTVLLRRDMSGARLTEWLGYLCVLADGEIFLADSRGKFSGRSSSTEYEWFRLTDIGVYDGQSPVYTTMTEGLDGYTYIDYNNKIYPIVYAQEERTVRRGESIAAAYPLPDEAPKNTRPFLLSEDENGESIAIPCFSSGEMSGGAFSPACELCSSGELLFFGCENGALCCFNNDKRAKISDDECDVGQIPRRYYTHNGRRYQSGFSTAYDSCGIFGMRKSTVSGSAAIRLRAHGGLVHIYVGTDTGGKHLVCTLRGDRFSLADTDFSNFSFSTHENISVRIPEKEKRWGEKQYEIYSNEFMRPFCIYGISYDYTVAGRISK